MGLGGLGFVEFLNRSCYHECLSDMEKGCVDEQSILTYIMSLNKVLGSKPPPLVPHLASEQGTNF